MCIQYRSTFCSYKDSPDIRFTAKMHNTPFHHVVLNLSRNKPTRNSTSLENYFNLRCVVEQKYTKAPSTQSLGPSDARQLPQCLRASGGEKGSERHLVGCSCSGPEYRNPFILRRREGGPTGERNSSLRTGRLLLNTDDLANKKNYLQYEMRRIILFLLEIGPWRRHVCRLALSVASCKHSVLNSLL